MLDLGTGPGFLAIDFAPLARGVTAVDPSAEMLSAAAANAQRAGVLIARRSRDLLGEALDAGQSSGGATVH